MKCPRRLCACVLVFAAAACGSRTELRGAAPLLDATVDTRDAAPDAPDAPDDPDGGGSSVGREFLAVQMASSQLLLVFSFGVMLGNPGPAPARVRITGGPLTAPIEQTLAPGSSVLVELPRQPELIQGSTTISVNERDSTSVLVEGGAFRIVSSEPIIAQQFNPTQFVMRYPTGTSRYSQTGDASLLLPTRALGREYVVATRENQPADRTRRSGAGGIIAITAPGDTAARVTLELTTRLRAGPGVEAVGPGRAEFLVRPGAVLQLIDDVGLASLTGTRITSDRPVAVFVGHDCASVSESNDTCDHLEEQLLPVSTWGQRYAVTAFRARSASEGSIVQIVGAEEGGPLTFDGIPTPAACAGPLRRGLHCELSTTANFVVTGSERMLVTQYMRGEASNPRECCADFPGCSVAVTSLPQCTGDPSMVTVVPVDRFLSTYPFFVPDTYTRAFANVVARGAADITLDGAPLPPSSEPVGSEFRVWVLPVEPGAHLLTSPSGQRFGLEIYGVAPYTSYALPGGLATD